MKDSELVAEKMIEKIIRDKLKEPVQNFICLCNTAVQKYRIKKIDFNKLQQNPVWEFSSTDIRENDCFSSTEPSRRKRLVALGKEISSLFPGLLNTLSLSVTGAELSLEQSILPLKEEFRQQHSPHLALLFAFLKLYAKFQNDLNGFTRKHLDFFYKDVLQLVPRSAVPDKVHVLFEIQNQLDKHLVAKSAKLKGGKDKNKKEILFATGDEIVVNKTKIAEAKTLFLNNRSVNNTSFLEGVYMAPNARMADGLEAPFTENMPKNWPTLGNKFSKYSDPESKLVKPYPSARLGFILASPVLLLNEGSRMVNIQLACEIDETVCNQLNLLGAEKDPCCAPVKHPVNDPEEKKKLKEKEELKRLCEPEPSKWIMPADIISSVNRVLTRSWRFISLQLIDDAVRRGINAEVAKKIKNRFLINECIDPVCCKKEKHYLAEHFVTTKVWNKFLADQVKETAAVELLNEIFPPRYAFRIHFSGEKEWIPPTEIRKMSIEATPDKKGFVLNLKLRLDANSPSVSFFNKDNLKEDLKTALPLVKIELDNDLGITLNQKLRKKLKLQGKIEDCCLYNSGRNCREKISLYQFFRHARLVNQLDLGSNIIIQTGVDVSVCGLRKFLVKNSESVQNSNGPVYIFGTNPEIIDFDPKNQPAPPIVTNLNLVGPSFYIGSAEVFYKKWDSVFINIDWRDKPTNFRDYYKGYFNDGAGNFGLNEDRFLVNISVLEKSNWVGEKDRVATGGNQKVTIKSIEYFDRKLFNDDGQAPFCSATVNPFPQTIMLDKDFFNLQQQFLISKDNVERFGFDSLNGFIRINLQVQDFRHRMYSYVLARQMMALGKLPEPLEDAVYYDPTLPPPHLIVFDADTIKNDVQDAKTIANRVNKGVNDNAGGGNPGGIRDNAGGLLPDPTRDITAPQSTRIREIIFPPVPILNPFGQNLTGDVNNLFSKLNSIEGTLNNIDDFQAVIPNSPWTPIANSLSLDYTASAFMKDIELVNLYPFSNTHKTEEITSKPTLFPTFCDEGNLFIGLDKLTPGSNLNILFQLAEATADSESLRQELGWYYLDNNVWKSLRQGFEVLNDASDQLTTSGIVKLALPGNMTRENTVLSKSLHWIRVSIRGNSRSIAETIDMHTQAMLAEFVIEPDHDLLRLEQAFAGGSISKLNEADPKVKTISQPYDSFGGREPEAEKHFYLRASELLRHKGRAIQKWDYERLVLEMFPQIYKAKCINHSYALDAKKYTMDFPIAPGYVVLAVIPDLTILKGGNSLEPMAPVSLLEEIEDSIRKRTSPFVRLSVRNPRYEKIHICLQVKLHKGKDEVYYKQKLADDLRHFLAPWSVGEYSKLSFGQSVNRSDLLRFLEGLEYLDYIIDLKMRHESDDVFNDSPQEIRTHTPRSILLAGIIDVCLRQDDCEQWGECFEDRDQRKVKVKCCEEEPYQVHDFCKP